MSVIIITGNIASGKSTVSEYFRNKYPDYTYLCIDQVRIDLYHEGMHGFALEREAERVMLALASAHEHLIYESTGNTLFFRRMRKEAIFSRPVTHYHVKCDPEECEYRFKIRKKTKFQVAPPYNKMSVRDSLWRNHHAYRLLKYDYAIPNDGSLAQLNDHLNKL